MRKRSAFKALSSLVGFAFAYQRVGRQERSAAEALGPKGGSTDKRRASGVGGKKLKDAQGGAADGRMATTPSEIPPRGLLAVGKRVASKFSENELMSEAASVTFYALLSIFPALTAIVSVYGLFTNPATIQTHLDSASGFIPSGGMQIIDEQVKRLTQSPSSGLSIGAIVGVLAAIWSANQGSKAMLSALNKVYGEKEERGFVKLTAVSLAFTVGGVLTLLAGIGALLVLPLIFRLVGLDGLFDMLVRVLRWPLVLIGIMVGLGLLYRFGPSRHRAQWRWVTWGGVIGAVSWIVLSFGFSWYVEHFGSYNKTYGSLGAIIGFMTWIWLSSTVLLLGAQINAELEAQTARDTTVGPGKPPGGRGAAAADTVAA